MSELVLERPADAARLLIEALLGTVQAYDFDASLVRQAIDEKGLVVVRSERFGTDRFRLWAEAAADARFWAEVTFVWPPAYRAGVLYGLYCAPGEAPPDGWLCSPLAGCPISSVLDELDEVAWRLRSAGDELWPPVVAAVVSQWEAWRCDLESGVAL